MSVRTVYRDLRAIDEEIGVPVWAEDGLWGVDPDKAFLPPLKLTQSEAMAVVLSARLMVRYADKYDPDLAAAFEKLAVGPAAGPGGARGADARRHVDRAARRGVQRARPAPDQGLGGASGRDHRLPARRATTAAPPPGGRPSGRTSSSHRSRPTPCT